MLIEHSFVGDGMSLERWRIAPCRVIFPGIPRLQPWGVSYDCEEEEDAKAEAADYWNDARLLDDK